MEKYRKFEDPSVGINPFIVAGKKTATPAIIQLLKPIFKFFLFILNLLALILIQFVLKFPVINTFSRPLEVFFSKIFSSILLILVGVYSTPYKFKRIDKKKQPNIIITSQSTFIDWFVLMNNYCPKFLAIVKSKDNKSDYFIELSYCDLIFYALGLPFPQVTDKNKYTKFNFDKYILEPNHVPLVIFPECTKTNRHGILTIRSNLLDVVYKLLLSHDKLILRSEIVINKEGIYNTTDKYGFVFLFNMCCRYLTKVEIISQDIPHETFDINEVEYSKEKFSTVQMYLDSNLQQYLMDLNHRNSVNLSWKDHIEFLDYYKKTSGDSKGDYVKEGKKF